MWYGDKWNLLLIVIVINVLLQNISVIDNKYVMLYVFEFVYIFVKISSSFVQRLQKKSQTIIDDVTM